MAGKIEQMNKNTDLGLLILRIAVGALMLLHGIAKLDGVSFIEGMIEGVGLPTFLAYGVYITEIVAPLFIIFSLNQHGGWGVELLGLYLFGSITLFFSGGGKIAVSSAKKWD
jgi:putative oxidoreductase